MESTPDFQAFKEALVAAARGPFFPDWEFHSLFGLDRQQVESIAASFDPATPLSGNVALALNNAIVNLLGYPHGLDAAWSQWFSVTPTELQASFQHWRASE